MDTAQPPAAAELPNPLPRGLASTWRSAPVPASNSDTVAAHLYSAGIGNCRLNGEPTAKVAASAATALPKPITS